MVFITKEHLTNSGDVRREARTQLKGRWKSAVLLNMVPFLLTLVVIGGAVGAIFIQSELGLGLFSEEGGGGIDVVINSASSFISIGITYTFLDFIRFSNYSITPLPDAFQVFSKKYFVGVLIIQLLQGLFIFLWALLFLIPGIIKYFSYSQSYFIYKDLRDEPNEEYPSANDCIRESKQLMRGHKRKLFSLELSFIGWYFVALITLGIALIWINPYINTARAVFYENISKGYFREEVEETKPYSQESVAEQAGIDPDDFSDFENDEFTDF